MVLPVQGIYPTKKTKKNKKEKIKEKFAPLDPNKNEFLTTSGLANESANSLAFLKVRQSSTSIILHISYCHFNDCNMKVVLKDHSRPLIPSYNSSSESFSTISPPKFYNGHPTIDFFKTLNLKPPLWPILPPLWNISQFGLENKT